MTPFLPAHAPTMDPVYNNTRTHTYTHKRRTITHTHTRRGYFPPSYSTITFKLHLGKAGGKKHKTRRQPKRAVRISDSYLPSSTHTHTHTHTHSHSHTHTHSRRHTHIHIDTHTHTITVTQTQARWSRSAVRHQEQLDTLVRSAILFF